MLVGFGTLVTQADDIYISIFLMLSGFNMALTFQGLDLSGPVVPGDQLPWANISIIKTSEQLICGSSENKSKIFFLDEWSLVHTSCKCEAIVAVKK
jgi:hypothetical protein